MPGGTPGKSVIKKVFFVSRVHVVEKNRLRVNAANKQLTNAVASSLNDSDVLVILLNMNEKQELHVTHAALLELKHHVLNITDKEELRETVAWWAWYNINSILLTLLGHSLWLDHTAPAVLEVRHSKAGNISVKEIYARGFRVMPTGANSNAVELECEFWDIDDKYDYDGPSRCTVKVNFKELLEDAGVQHGYSLI